jgi:uncharacterized Zn-binding protein involved in type VI secretion
MAKIMRQGDTFSGTCSKHGSVTGTIDAGSSIGMVDNKSIARVGDKGTCSCGHKFTITSGSSIVTLEGLGICRVGDTATVDVVGGSLVAVSGSPTSDCL